MLKGMQPIGGKWYYLDETTGALWTGGWKQNLKGAYFWSGADGIVPYGLNEIEGTWRYIDPNTGYLRFGFIDVYSGGRTYANNDGVIKTGWVTVNGKQYYVKPDTRLLATGTLTIGDITYKFGEDGALLQTITKPGWHEVDGQKYYYDENGQMLKGMQPIGGKWYYLDETTGALWTGGWKQNLKGAYFWSGADGIVPYGLNEIEGTWRYIDPNTGYLRFGFIDVYSGGRTYANSEGVIKTGWITVDGKQYYVDPDTKLLLTGWQTVGGQKYYFDATGQQLKGMQPINGYWYYLDETTGVLWTSGWKQLSGGKIWSDATGKIPLGYQVVDGYWRYFSVNTGYLQTGFFIVHTGGQSYADTEGRVTAGWKNINGKFYCIDDKTLEFVKGWVELDGNRFYFKSDYTGATGPYKIDGNWYYFEYKWGSLVRNTTVVIDGVSYQVDANGVIQNYFPDKAYGIDVSSHQGVIDWQQVANSGVSFAMIRALTWSNSANYYVIDPYFEVNVRNAKANGIKVSVYLYSYAFSEAEIEEEVFFFLNSAELKRLRDDGIVFDYPVYIDYEDPLVINNVLDPQRKTDIVRHGMNILDQNGYLPGFYTYDYFARSLMNAQQLINEGYEFWVAHTSATSNPWGDAAGIWQYSHTGKVPGIQGNVDLNYAYKNYPSIINPGGGTTPDPVGETLSVYDSVTGKTVTDSVENILAAIVQAEVGGTKLTGLDARTLFQAQAVAAHSWILFSQNNGESYPSVVLASQDKITSAVRQAVAQVANYVVMYNGIPACTVYGSASAGVTNSSQNMGWNSQPYLVNVTSPYESMYGAAWQNKTNTIGIARMKDNIENKLGISTAGYDYANWLTNPVFDQYGYCTQITVCGKVVSGGKFYENCYGLYSPNFTFQYLGSTQGWKFVTQGNGHCVGMSQYGAMGYAANGYTWQQILQHYYPGTTITTIK